VPPALEIFAESGMQMSRYEHIHLGCAPAACGLLICESGEANFVSYWPVKNYIM
jgi:hypothetical protein